MSKRITLSTPVTHLDWMWSFSKRIGHGEKSVKYILDRCKEVGWQRVYWRCFGGGRALYASKLADEVWIGRDEDNYHAWADPNGESTQKNNDRVHAPYKEFDSLKEAVDYGHKIGLEIHAWISINEDAHDWGTVSKFSRKHPQFRWVKRSGMPYNSQLSFAFQEVREYKLGLLKEILAYDIDGIFFDWVRTGDVRNEPQTTPDGTADFGYEKPLLEGFKKKYGLNLLNIPSDDQRGVRFRAEPQTIFMREAHKLIKAKGRSLLIAVMSAHPWYYRCVTYKINGNLHGLLIDVATWAKEGLIDEVVANGNISPGSDATPEKICNYQKDEVNGHCDTWLYWWVPPDAKDFKKSIKTAEKLGVKQILYWESDYIDHPDSTHYKRASNAKKLTEAMSKYAYGK